MGTAELAGDVGLEDTGSVLTTAASPGACLAVARVVAAFLVLLLVLACGFVLHSPLTTVTRTRRFPRWVTVVVVVVLIVSEL